MELKTEGLYRNFGDFTFGADISAEEGELVCLLGPSGCGKTTALRMIAGITRPERGRIFLGGRDITDLPPWKRTVGLVFQDYALFPHMNVFENVAYGLRSHHWREKEIRERVGELLDLVGLPSYGARMPASLSGGEQQRIALARALAPGPSLLLLDEPLSALDAQLRKRLRREISSIQRELGLTTIYVTHDQEEGLSMSDRIILLRDGSQEQSGTPEELYSKPNGIFSARFLGSSNLIPLEELEGPDVGQTLLRYPGAESLPGYERLDSRESAMLFFRPEDTVVRSEPSTAAEGEIGFEVPLTHCEYLGSHFVVEGAFGGTSLRAYSPSRVFAEGRRLYFSVPREKTRLLSAAPSATLPDGG